MVEFVLIQVVDLAMSRVALQKYHIIFTVSGFNLQIVLLKTIPTNLEKFLQKFFAFVFI